MTDVMFYEVFKEEEKALKKFLPKNIKAGFTSQTVQASAGKIPPASLISIRTQSKIPSAWAQAGLRGILTRSTGYDHLIEYQKKDISCGYLGDYCARAVAEQAVMMMMALLRQFKKQVRNFERFNRDDITGGECQGRRLLVVGVGCIGRQVVDIGRGLRMDVKGVDIKKNVRGLTYVPLEKGVVWADAIICALPLTAKTPGLLGYSLLKKARPGFVFVNVSRGEVSPIGDLARLLRTGKCGGCGFDVFEQEDQVAECLQKNKKSKNRAVDVVLSLRQQDNVIFTPHNAFNTHESVQRKSRLSAAAVVVFLGKGKFPFPVPAKQL